MTFRKFLAAATLIVCCCFTPSKSYATIVITEFINNPTGSDERFEWVELFNAGPTAANLTGWTLKDNSVNTFTFQDVVMQSGGYLIVANNKTDFQARWLAGVADDRVIGNRGFNLNNTAPGDGLYLRNAAGDLVFSLGYAIGPDGEPASDESRATFLTEFTGRTNYGIPPQDGAALMRRAGEDFPGELGYELNSITTDPFAYTAGGDTGSPLLGGYSVVPEPNCVAVLGLGALMLARRRRN